MKNTIVIKPSIGRDELPDYHTIIDSRVAEGFSASSIRVNQMYYIIIIDGLNNGSIAVIERSENLGPLNNGGKSRARILFGEPIRIERPNTFLENKGVTWSQNNIRYIHLSQEDLNVLNQQPPV
jgi:hypothetical protein